MEGMKTINCLKSSQPITLDETLVIDDDDELEEGEIEVVDVEMYSSSLPRKRRNGRICDNTIYVVDDDSDDNSSCVNTKFTTEIKRESLANKEQNENMNVSLVNVTNDDELFVVSETVRNYRASTSNAQSQNSAGKPSVRDSPEIIDFAGNDRYIFKRGNMVKNTHGINNACQTISSLDKGKNSRAYSSVLSNNQKEVCQLQPGLSAWTTPGITNNRGSHETAANIVMNECSRIQSGSNWTNFIVHTSDNQRQVGNVSNSLPTSMSGLTKRQIRKLKKGILPTKEKLKGVEKKKRKKGKIRVDNLSKSLQSIDLATVLQGECQVATTVNCSGPGINGTDVTNVMQGGQSVVTVNSGGVSTRTVKMAPLVWTKPAHLTALSQNKVIPPHDLVKDQHVSLANQKQCKNDGTNIFNPEPTPKQPSGSLRPVVIDACNVAFGHGKKHFSSRGLEICIDYFLKRGHKVKAFMPLSWMHGARTTDPHILADLEKKGTLITTPSRRVQGKMISPYDDRYIVQFANEVGAIIVTTDNYRDLLSENAAWRETIEERLLMFTWADDILMFPHDPLGRDGPSLEEFLKFP